MELTDINNYPLELGQKVCWLSRAGLHHDYHDDPAPLRPVVRTGTVISIRARQQQIYWGPDKGKTKVLTTITIQPDQRGIYTTACRNPKRIGVIGWVDETRDAVVKAKVAALDAWKKPA